MTLVIRSSAFASGGVIPNDHVQDGANRSPPLQWEGAPEGTKSFALILEDHDAPVGTYTHWAVYDIAPDSDGLLEGLDAEQVLQGQNDAGHAYYDGPKPPKGHGPHKYHFRLVALGKASLGLSEKPGATEVKNAARMHVLAEAELVGVFETT